ncbi:hypothetical protein [Allorhizocola rhizosphaerae]|uniref:hypothetical protein n=1 Tax=Allorhizocola rhizosphaerae TaxID=1872709 RepID=UPI001FE5F6D9|nr:hypothetical protein [Allorhizocola rhizosphaerae]
MTTDSADYSRWGRYASAEVEAAETPARSPWGADASADLDVDDADSAGRVGLWGEGEADDEFGYADDVEDEADDVEGESAAVDVQDDGGEGGDETGAEVWVPEAGREARFEATDDVVADADVNFSYAADSVMGEVDARFAEAGGGAAVESYASFGEAGGGAAVERHASFDEGGGGAAAESPARLDDAAGDTAVEADVWVEAAEDGAAEDGVPVMAVVGAEQSVAAGFVSTGHEAVDAAVRAVENASRLPVAEQLAAYEAAHTTLREVLGSIEE